MDIDEPKRRAAAAAIDRVESGMVVGLGTGSSAWWAVERLGELLAEGALADVTGIPTSEATAAQARGLGIPLADLGDHPVIDYAVDGADEVAPDMSLTKGWGGALVREKIVALAARSFAVVVDESKLVDKLGTRGPVPVEVAPFAWRAQARWLEGATSCRARLRGGPDNPFLSDNGNLILDCMVEGGLDDPGQFADAIAGRTGVVGHGLFLGLATEVFVGSFGEVRTLAPG